MTHNLYAEATKGRDCEVGGQIFPAYHRMRLLLKVDPVTSFFTKEVQDAISLAVFPAVTTMDAEDYQRLVTDAPGQIRYEVTKALADTPVDIFGPKVVRRIADLTAKALVPSKFLLPGEPDPVAEPLDETVKEPR